MANLVEGFVGWVNARNSFCILIALLTPIVGWCVVTVVDVG